MSRSVGARMVASLWRLWDRRVMSVGKAARASQFAVLPRRGVELLFVGDSITEFGLWSEWFPDHRTANRGIAGQRIAEIRSRLDTLPDADVVLLLIGTNDISAGATDAAILDDLGQLVGALRHRFPEARLIVQGLMPRTAALAPRIRGLNSEYRTTAAAHGAEYLDLHPALATTSGALRPECTLDHLHLTGEGYVSWMHTLHDALGIR